MADSQTITLNENDSDNESMMMDSEALDNMDDETIDEEGNDEEGNDEDSINEDEDEDENSYESSEKIDDIKTDNSIYDDNDTDIFEQLDPEIELKRNLRVPDNERITIPKLTKYEKVRLLGTRAKQISDGSKVFIKSKKVRNAMDIAELELKHKVIPLKIKRPLPNGKYEIWSINELEIV
jgi:DNA-directed RNA polymerase I, II, and III subunit RPABC2